MYEFFKDMQEPGTAPADGSAVCGNARLDGEDRGWVVSGLPVACRADLDGNGQLNFFDVALWLQSFNAQGPVADWNSDGLFDFFDITAFLVAFNAVCP